MKPKEYKKLWNLHWALHTAWQKKQEGKWKQRQRTADESAQETSVDGQNLTICGGCQGYMDFFSEVFCVVSFFFSSSSLHFCTPRKHQDGKHYQRLKEGTNTQRYFPERRFSQSARFFFPFLFSTNSFPLF